jgi:chitodextrinase
MYLRHLFLALLSCFLAASAHAFNFSVSTLNGATVGPVTSLQFGPDNRLYAAQVDGTIKAFTIQRSAPNNYQVTATEIITLVRDLPNYDDTGIRNFSLTTRQVTGLLVTGTSTSPIVYVTSSDPRIGGGSGGENDLNLDTNSGIISRLTRTNGVWSKVDLVRGLPRSEENHASNGMQYDPATNILYLAQGGNTNAGAPSINFAYMCETALSAAILSIDLNAINALPAKTDQYGQKYLYDLPTVDDPNPNRAHNADGSNVNDPFGGNDGLNQAKLVPGGPVQIYASGFRNAYDLVITHSPGAEGRMYTFDNGANLGWGGYPTNQGAQGTVSNVYPEGEPGTVNNRDTLHFITGRGYYGGHPNPIRANPAGAGWFHYDNSLPAASAKTYSASPTSDWPSVPVSMANPIEGAFHQSGVDDGSLMTTSGSTNGLTEYVATNFNGAMQGNLIAANYTGGQILRIALNATGTAVTNGVEVLASGFGSQPLDVTAPDPGHGGPFLGTLWVGHYYPAKISILEPADFDNPGSNTCTGVNSFEVDEDGDGYSNADEIANGSDPCSGAIRPPDFDGDHISDLLDPDDDNDGIPDIQDPFPLDPTNGHSVPFPVHYELFNETGIGFYGVGFTGLMMNRGEDYLKRITKNNVIAGGTAGLFTIEHVGPGTPLGSTNTQMDAYQFGFNSDEFTTPFVITSRMGGPFFDSTPTGNQKQGIYLGYGDQDNYVSLALHANGGALGFEVVYEVGGVVTFQQLYPVAVGNSSVVDLSFVVDPLAGKVQPRYQIDGAAAPIALGTPIAVSGDVLMSLMGRYPLAIGLFANTGGGSTPSFSATWDYFDVAPVPSTAMAKVTIDPNSTNMSTASTYANGSFKIQNLSTGGQQIESVTMDLTTAIFPDVIFDVTGTAGDNVFKVFTPNTISSGVSLNAGTMTNPHNGVDADDGYDGVDITFNSFPTNGTFTFSIDNDPNNIKGVLQPGEHDAASISGLELIGTDVTVFFSDGTAQRTRVGRVETSIDGAYGWARADKPPKPAISLVGQTSPLQTGQAQQTVHVMGPAGLNVSLVRIEAGLYLGGVPNGGYHVHPFDANTALTVTETSGVIPPSGMLDMTVIATKSDARGGYNYITATLSDSNGVKGPTSDQLTIWYDPSFTGADTQPPTQPAGLTAGTVSSRSVTLNWQASTDNVGVAGYTIYRDGSLLTSVTTLSSTDFGLDGGKTYNYSVVARDQAGNTSPAATLGVPVPSNGVVVLRVNAGGPAFVDGAGNTWAADSGFNTGTTTSTSTSAIDHTLDDKLFQTDRVDSSTSLPSLIYNFPLANGQYEVQLYFAEVVMANAAVGKRVFDISLQGQVVSPGFDIFAQAGAPNTAVMAMATTTVSNGQLNITLTRNKLSPKLNAIKVIQLPSSDTVPPTSPGNLTATNVTANSATLSWTASTDNVGVLGYLVGRDGANVTTTSSLNYTDTGLTAATAYQYSVTATDSAGNLSGPANLAVTTTSATGDTQAPSAPGPVTFSNITTTAVTLNWTAATDNVGVTGYRVSRGGTLLTTVASPTYSDSGLSPSTSYAYSIVAIDAAGNGSPASTGNVTTASVVAPSSTVRINAGGPAYTDGSGNVWAADTGFNTGSTTTSTATVSGTTNPTLYKTERYDAPAVPELTYTFSVPNGSYLVRLFFAETYTATMGAGLRVFDVNVQNQLAFGSVDIFSQAGGGNKALVLQKAVTVTTGQIQIGFIHKTENPKINSIEIVPDTGNPPDTQAPTAPTGLGTSNITSTSATLNWTASTDNVGVTGYKVSRNGALVGTVTTTTYPDSGLTASTAYAYAVTAVDAAGNNSPAATVSLTTAAASDTQAPTAPGSLTFTNITTGSVTINWTAATDNVGVTGYNVSRDGALLGTVNATTYADSGRAPGTSYTYSVVAVDAAGNSSPATTATVTTATAPDTQAPTAPGSLTFTNVTASSVTVNWTAATDNVGVTGYRVSRAGLSPVTVSALTYTDGSVAAGTTYTYSVVAVDAAGNVSTAQSASVATAAGNGGVLPTIRVNAGGPAYVDPSGNTWSADTGFNTGKTSVENVTVTGTTMAQLFRTVRYDDTTAPELTYAFTVPNGSYKVRLYFSENTAANNAPGKRVFDVNVQTQPTFQNVDIYSLAGGLYKAATLETVATVTNGQLAITFLHRINNPRINAIEILPATASSDTQPPTTPTAFSSSNLQSTSVSLSWAASTDDTGVTGYQLTRNGTLLTTVAGLSFTDNGLSPSTAYTYTVAAIDAAGNLSGPASLAVTTPAPTPDTQPPTAPTNLVASNVTANSLTLSWTAATDNVGVTSYKIYRDTALLGTATTTSYNDTGLSANTAYSYVVVALDAAGNSTSSAPLSVTSPAAGSFTPIRVNTGGPVYVDTTGNTWAADTGFNTGKTSVENVTVTNSADPQLYRTVRYDDTTSPELMYAFNVPNGTYTVRLLLSENNASLMAVGKRVFDINVQGAVAFQNVDIFAQAGGGYKALVLQTTATVTNGQLQIQFLHKVNNPRVNGIEILLAP